MSADEFTYWLENLNKAARDFMMHGSRGYPTISRGPTKADVRRCAAAQHYLELAIEDLKRIQAWKP